MMGRLWKYKTSLLALLYVGVLAQAGGCGGQDVPEDTANPIEIENRAAGSDGWQFWRRGLTSADDATGQVKGYASATSVARGETITLHVSVNPAQAYWIDVYRIGWYGGAGGRLLQTVGPLDGTRQPACPIDAVTGLTACVWSPGYVLEVPATWTSGVYLTVLRTERAFANFVMFVVRDDERTGGVLYQQSVTTYQAYNRYPDDGVTGKSLYPGSYGAKTIFGDRRAVKVSFDRPYSNRGAGEFLWWEINFVRWIERAGYDVTYSTNLDTHIRGERLVQADAFLSVGHDEYWSTAMRDAIEAARDAGTHLAFFGANDGYWRIRLEPSATGRPNRIMVCFRKRVLDLEGGNRPTVRWRDSPLNRPEQALIGTQYGDIIAGGIAGPYADYVVTDSAHWVYDGSGLADGDVVTGIVGYETDRNDREAPQPPQRDGSFALLSRSPYRSFPGTPVIAQSSIYRAPSGAWVFAAGTIGWSLGLDDFGERGRADPRLQRVTSNILERFLARRGAPPGHAAGSKPRLTPLASRRTPRMGVDASLASSTRMAVAPSRRRNV